MSPTGWPREALPAEALTAPRAALLRLPDTIVDRPELLQLVTPSLRHGDAEWRRTSSRLATGPSSLVSTPEVVPCGPAAKPQLARSPSFSAAPPAAPRAPGGDRTGA